MYTEDYVSRYAALFQRMYPIERPQMHIHDRLAELYLLYTSGYLCTVIAIIADDERANKAWKNNTGQGNKKARRQRETGKAWARLYILLCKSRQSRPQLLLLASESLLGTRRALLVQRLRLEKLLVDHIASALLSEILPQRTVPATATVLEFLDHILRAAIEVLFFPVLLVADCVDSANEAGV